MRKIKAILLAAGLGSRLSPLTKNKPKCLMEINHVPILQIWINKLVQIGCSEILINTHYLSNQVNEFIQNNKFNNLRISITHEENLLGTAGTLLKNIDFVESTTFLMHVDNYTTCNLNGILNQHINKPKDCLLTMLTFETNTPSQCGVVETDKNGVIKAFYEKVNNPPSNIANGAVYIFDNQFINWLKNQNKEFVDFSNDVIPCLINKIQTWHTNEFYIDIGTQSALKLAQEYALKQNNH